MKSILPEICIFIIILLFAWKIDRIKTKVDKIYEVIIIYDREAVTDCDINSFDLVGDLCSLDQIRF